MINSYSTEQEKYEYIASFISIHYPKNNFTEEETLKKAKTVLKELEKLFPSKIIGYYFGRDILVTDDTEISYNPYTNNIWFLKNKKPHRINGPARISIGPQKTYNFFYIDSRCYSEEKYWNHPLVIKNKLNSIINL